MARDAIRAEKAAPRMRADRSPQAVLAKLQAKQAKGEALTEADLGALAAALAQEESRKQRGRGRPKGARDFATLGALRAAIYAVQESGLPNPYRNNIGPRLSQCDAIADAMQAEGFRTMNTYDAARREMIAFRRAWRGASAAISVVVKRWQAMSRDLAAAVAPAVRQAQEATQAFGEALRPMQREMQQAGGALAALGARLRAQTTLTPETRRAIEKALKAKR